MIPTFNPYTIIYDCFRGCLVKRGCGLRAHLIFQDMIVKLGLRIKSKSPFKFLTHMLMDLKPAVSILKKKHGGTTFNIPYLISPQKGLEIAIHWLVKDTFNKPMRRDMSDCLVQQIVDYTAGRNSLLKRKRDEVYKTARAGRPFLRYK
jgi:ribosomal protein S7